MSRTETALSDIPDSELVPSLDDDTTEQAAPQPEETPQTDVPAPEPQQPDAETPAAEIPTDAEPAGQVPAWRLKEEADKRREADDRYNNLNQQFGQLQGQLQAFQGQLQRPQQEPAKPVDPYEDPAGYQRQQNEQTMQTVNARLHQQSKAFAYELHGKETVDEAYSWAVNNLPLHEANAVAQSANPFGECVARKKQADTLAEIGTDPAAYREKVLSEALKNPDFVAKVQLGQRQQVQANPDAQKIDLPPSLDSIPAAADAKADAGSELLPMTDAEIAADALAFDPYK